ncbi:probable crossover junction endonuclease EME2 [Trichomycterus rosablanca]|uniref:probable crossover junction endonuclease EME2 n=1 Tax=Trichomycterus rosablanca TaxID=2290929 RepID=UPI002F352444
MSGPKRAHTWEISDSDTEDGGTVGGTEGGADQDGGAVGERTCDPIITDQSSEPGSGSQPPPEPTTRSPTPGERRREKRRGKQEKRGVKEEREKQKEEREKQKEEREKQKEVKRQEQMRRKEVMEEVRRLRPEEYLKSVTLHIHPVLLQESGCDVLLNVLAGLGWRNRIDEHDLTHSISWTRQLPHTDGEGDEGEVEEDQVLMVINQTEFIDMMTSIKQALIGECEGAETLFQPLSEYLNRNAATVVSLLVTGGQRLHTQSHAHRGASYDDDDDDDDDDLCPRSQLGLQSIDIEEVLVYLQLYKNVSVQFMFGWQEVTDHVCAVTKALSKRPFKRQYDVPDLGFCVDGSWAGGVRVDKSGRGLAQVWTRQLQQLNRVSVAMATAVTTAYPSPRLLLQAFEHQESPEEQRRLLADLTVTGAATGRRIGPELSSRVHRLMTSQNPELVLD